LKNKDENKDKRIITRRRMRTGTERNEEDRKEDEKRSYK
jgi:hypothetical protein